MIATATSSWVRVGAAGMLLTLATVAPAAAQRAQDRPVILALPEAFPEVSQPGVDALALVYRFGGPGGRADIIVLNPAHASPQALRVAVLALRRFRESGELDGGRKLVIPVVPDSPTARGRAASFGAALERLRSRPRAGGIQGLGAARWLEFHDVDEISRSSRTG